MAKRISPIDVLRDCYGHDLNKKKGRFTLEDALEQYSRRDPQTGRPADLTHRPAVQRVMEGDGNNQPAEEGEQPAELSLEEKKQRTLLQTRRGFLFLAAMGALGGMIAIKDSGKGCSGADNFDGIANNIDLEKNEINAKARARVLLYEPDHRIISVLRQNFDKKDSLVHTNNYAGKHYPSKIQVRSTTSKCFQVARKTAQEMGYDIVVMSGYRSKESQEKLYPKWYQPWRWHRRGGVVAKPGSSPHQTGGAMDCALIRLSDGKRVTYFDYDNQKSTQYTDALEYCMNRAGFVRYKGEIWHFEIGTKDWVKIMQKQDYLPKGKASKYRYDFIED